MRITTMITLPEDVYQFYREQASRQENRTTEQVMADALAAFAAAHAAPET